MTDMIERIARALRSHSYGVKWDNQPFNPENDSGDMHWLEAAKAALTALEQPSDEMKRAGAQKFYEKFDPNIDPGESDFGSVFSKMIKAARGDQ
jgi:hypothetical protein